MENEIKNSKNNRSGHPLKSTNTKMSIPIVLFGKTVEGSYDVDSLIKILKETNWKKISVPVWGYKELFIVNSAPKKGIMDVGYITGYNSDTDELNVVIYGKNVKVVKSFEDAVIYPRVSINDDGTVKTVLGLDVCPRSRYEYLIK